ncbi:MAG: DUF2284 domain-containing protein [Candidatus Hodarchaeota archaeon]
MNIDSLIEINALKINKESIKFSKKTRIWCQLPYPNHPAGCPNYNKNPLCPPNSEYINNILNIYSNFYLIYAKFDLKSQRERMLSKYSDWTYRKANCLLYWQGSVKKALKEYIQEIYKKNNVDKIFLLSCGSGFNINNLNQKTIYSMEAAGIDVFATLRNNNISFELKPMNKVLMVTLLCSQYKLLF